MNYLNSTHNIIPRYRHTLVITAIICKSNSTPQQYLAFELDVFFIKLFMYKKMSIKNSKNFKKTLRNSLTSNTLVLIFKTLIFLRALWQLQNWASFSIFSYQSFSVFIINVVPSSSVKIERLKDGNIDSLVLHNYGKYRDKS